MTTVPTPGPTVGPLARGLDRDGLVAATAAGSASVPPGARLVVALSGGPDSTALAYLVVEARPDLDVTLVHVRHGLRDDAVDVDVVRRHATYLGCDLEVREVTVTADGHGGAAAARDARYAALREVATARGAVAIAVGHTAEDQAETVLLRVARGTGVSGLAAMATRSGDVLRPLLRVRRDDLATFVAEEGLPTATDPSNADPGSRRVRVRTAVLPALAEVGPDPVAALARLADLAAEDDAALADAAAALVARHAVVTGDVVAVPTATLDTVPPAVRRRMWRQVLAAVAGGAPPAAADVVALDALADGRRRQVGAAEVTVAGGWATVAPLAPPDDPGPRTVAVPGTTPWRTAGVVLVARVPGDDTAGPSPAAMQIAFELSGAWTPPVPDERLLAAPPGGHRARSHVVLPDTGPWTVRPRRDGDRIATSVGRVRVVDAFADAGVPTAVRERWPVVADAADRVVWVPGVAVDAGVRAAGAADPALQLLVAVAASHERPGVVAASPATRDVYAPGPATPDPAPPTPPDEARS